MSENKEITFKELATLALRIQDAYPGDTYTEVTYHRSMPLCILALAAAIAERDETR